MAEETMQEVMENVENEKSIKVLPIVGGVLLGGSVIFGAYKLAERHFAKKFAAQMAAATATVVEGTYEAPDPESTKDNKTKK